MADYKSHLWLSPLGSKWYFKSLVLLACSVTTGSWAWCNKHLHLLCCRHLTHKVSSWFQPKVVISANCGVEPTRVVPYKPMLDGALDLSEFQPSTCIIFNRPQVSGFERVMVAIHLHHLQQAPGEWFWTCHGGHPPASSSTGSRWVVLNVSWWPSTCIIFNRPQVSGFEVCHGGHPPASSSTGPRWVVLNVSWWPSTCIFFNRLQVSGFEVCHGGHAFTCIIFNMPQMYGFEVCHGGKPRPRLW